MRRIATVCLVVSLLPVAAAAAEGWTCWSGAGGDGSTSESRTVTRCRIAGSAEVRDYDRATGDSPPVVLRPTVGDDAEGTCWYWTSRRSNWVILGFDADGNAVLGYDPDGIAGGPIAVDTTERACTSEPAESSPSITAAYELLSRYVHPEPSVEVNPGSGRGITGMETFVAVDRPPRWSDSLVSPASGMRLEVETWVDAVEIDWGDGETTVVPFELLGLLTGYPDGAESHVYEAKTCSDPGGPRCHPTLSSYPLTVSYLWKAHYRVDAGPWEALVVEPTSTEVDYPVAEIVGVLTATG